MHTKNLWPIFFLLFLTGCRVGPFYDPPDPPVPEEWKTEHEDMRSGVWVDHWWEVFEDPLLNELEQSVLDNNPNLYVAIERVFEAQANAGIVGADLYPQVDFNPVYSNTGILFKLFGLPQDIMTQFAIKKLIRIHQMLYTFPINMRYEVDLWGRLQSQYESALLSIQAQEEAYYTILLTLTSDLASHYFNMRSLDAQLDLLTHTINTRKTNVRLTEARFTKGIVTYLDVAEASLDLANSEAEYADTVRMRNLMENAIAALIGVPASDLKLCHDPLVTEPPLIPAGIPSAVLQRRPDVAEAERSMASEHKLIGAAYASFLPSLSLTGALGFSSPEFEHFMKWKSRYWNLTATGGQTIFDGWRKCSDLQLSWSRYRAAAGNYQQAVLTAFREVEDSLSDIEWRAKQHASLGRAVEAATKATSLSKRRYINGISNYLEVVINQRSELEVRRTYINTLGLRYQATIQLIKALGGGWDVDCN